MKWLSHYYNQLLELNFKTWVVSLLVVWLPISNLAVQYTVNIWRGPTLIANIKDVLIVGLMVNLSIEIFLMIKKAWTSSQLPISKKILLFIRPCLPLLIIGILNILAILSSFIFNRIGFKVFIIGYYFELFWLDLLAIWLTWNSLRAYQSANQDVGPISSGSDRLSLIAPKSATISGFEYSVIIRSICIGFVLVAIVSIASIGFGQIKVLENFGYGQVSTGGLVSSNNPCHTIDYGISTCRLMGTFGHPLHFVSYLLLAIGVFLNQLVRVKSVTAKTFYGILTGLSLMFIYFSHTRFAIFGLILTFLWLVFGYGGSYMNREYLFFGKIIRLWIAKVAMLMAVIGILIITVLVVNMDINIQFPELAAKLPRSLTKPSSSAWHVRQTSSNMQVIADSPDKLFTGFGLGQAGSTARVKYQNLELNPIYKKILAQGNFPPDWIREYIMIPDNWLIQTTLNGGLIYTPLYLILLLWPLGYIWELSKADSWNSGSVANGFLICAMLGILIGCLIQQLLESQVTVFIFTVICGFLTKAPSLAPHKAEITSV